MTRRPASARSLLLWPLIATLTARRDGALGPKLWRNMRRLCQGKFGSVRQQE